MNRCFLAATLLCFCVGSVSARAADQYPVTLERDVPVTMRDGVVLRADVYRPLSAGRFPVLLQRTPYNKAIRADFAVRAATRGYVVILQDVRGRYASAGEWYPFKFESLDGYDTVEWAAALPYSNGKVGMFGGSYVGATQMLAAIASPPHLAGICPIVTASNYHNGWTYQDGAFEQWFSQSWASGLATDTVDRYLPAASNAFPTRDNLPLSKYSLFQFGSNSAGPGSTANFAPYYLDWLAHPSYDDYWRRWSIEDHYAAIRVPALTIAAWYDIFLGGALRNYAGVKAAGGTEEARQNQRLIIALGGHAGFGRKIGDLDFGTAVEEFDQDNVTLEWYDFLFKGVPNGFATGKPVRIFVMGANVWRDEDAWPLTRAVNTQYFLHSDGRANSLSGKGTLSETMPGVEAPDQYIYNPADPVATTGGPLCCDTTRILSGPRDQRQVEGRQDVLVYSAAPFDHDTEVTGAISVELYAKSSAVNTDFTAKLVDVWPNGFAQNLTEGIVRATYRDSQVKPSLLVPGQVYKFNLDLWSTSNLFLAGHTLRLEISSSNFPRFDRNLNTAESASTSERFISATNTILHDRAHPSALILPIVPSH